MTTLLAFLLTLGVLIVVHEYGHYRVAVACGVKVLRFSVGFGRVLWKHQRDADSTEFVVCALPLGGFVRMLDEREGPVDAKELHRAFNRQPLSRRAAIVAAGPLANLLLAVLLYAAAHWLGVDEPKAVLATPPAGSLVEASGLRGGDWVRESAPEGEDWQPVSSLSDLRWLITQAALHAGVLQLRVSDREGHGARTVRLDLARVGPGEVDSGLMKRIGMPGPFSEARVQEARAGGPAAAGGLQRGDRVLAIDGVAVADASQVVERIRASVQGATAAAQTWRVERGGQTLELQITPRVLTEGERRIGRVDAIFQGPEFVKVRHGFVDGLVKGAERTWEISALTVRMLGRMLVGQASIRNLSGPLTIADYAGQSVQQGLAYYLGFLALVSVSLGVLNLLPVPVLDGGHLMYYIFEAITGRPVSEQWLERLQRGGIAVLLVMMSVALFNDITRFDWSRLLVLH